MNELNWKIKKVKLSDVKEYEANPRTMTEKGLNELKESYRKFGQMHPLKEELKRIRVVKKVREHKRLTLKSPKN